MLKAQGHHCALFENSVPKGQYDEIWLSIIFTYDTQHVLDIATEAAKKGNVRIGGIAASLLPERFSDFAVHVGLLEEAESLVPDYSLLKYVPKYSILRTSRGCVRNCGFCMVRKLEPTFVDRPNWPNNIHPSSTELVFYDNNWLAKPTLDVDIQKLHQVCFSGRIKAVDFNQGLDCRLVTPEKIKSLQGIPIKPVRLAFDGMHEDGYLQSAVEMFTNVGYSNFSVYVLWNYTDTPQDFYYRLKEITMLHTKLGVQVVAYPMRYHPVLSDSRDYVGPRWTEQMKKSFSASLPHISATGGQLSLYGKKGKWTPIEQFEFWYGRTEEEFVERLNAAPFHEYWTWLKGLQNAHLARTQKPASWHRFWSEYRQNL